RARGELLVPAPPRGLRVGRRVGGGPARRRPRLRGGLRLGPARALRRKRRRRGREPAGVRTRAAALPGAQPALRARPRRVVRRALRRDRLPADDRARAGPGRASGPLRPPGAGLLRLDAEPPDARAAGRRALRQPLAPARVQRARVRRAPAAAFPAGRALRPPSRAQAPRPRPGPAPGLGPRPRGAPPDPPLLRPLRARDRRLRLSPLRPREPRPRARLRRRLPCLTRSPRGRWPSSSTRTCPTSRASGPTRSARRCFSTPSSAPTCRSSPWRIA